MTMTILWPNGTTTRPTVRSDYGMRLHPVDKVNKLHAGIDLVGFPVIKSPVAGRIVRAGNNGSAGLTVDVREHATGVVFRHFHLKQIDVVLGEDVAPGDRLGLMGATGKVTGVHLHFEVRINGTAQNPTTYYAARSKEPDMSLNKAQDDALSQTWKATTSGPIKTAADRVLGVMRSRVKPDGKPAALLDELDGNLLREQQVEILKLLERIARKVGA